MLGKEALETIEFLHDDLPGLVGAERIEQERELFLQDTIRFGKAEEGRFRLFSRWAEERSQALPGGQQAFDHLNQVSQSPLYEQACECPVEGGVRLLEFVERQRGQVPLPEAAEAYSEIAFDWGLKKEVTDKIFGVLTDGGQRPPADFRSRRQQLHQLSKSNFQDLRTLFQQDAISTDSLDVIDKLDELPGAAPLYARLQQAGLKASDAVNVLAPALDEPGVQVMNLLVDRFPVEFGRGFRWGRSLGGNDRAGPFCLSGHQAESGRTEGPQADFADVSQRSGSQDSS